MIPKILHVIWLENGPFPHASRVDRWCTLNPDWTVRLWRAEDLGTYAWHAAPAMRTMARRGLQACAEAMRWEILHNEGGFVADADTVWLRPLPSHLLETECFASVENETAHPGMVSARYVGSRAGNPLMGQMVLDMRADADLDRKEVSAAVGAERLNALMRAHGYADMHILPSRAFMPRHPSAPSGPDTGDAYGFKLWQDGPTAHFTEDDAKAFGPVHDTATQPRVTIGIPTWNSARFIREALRSAIAQDYANTEILIVDDGSTDGTADIVREFTDGRIRYVRQANAGIAAARNRVIAEARGSWLLWLDSDDILSPGLLSTYMATVRRHPEAAVVYGDLEKFDSASGRSLGPMNFHDHFDDPVLLSRLMVNNHIPNPATMILLKAARAVGLYDTQLKSASDYDFWLRTAAAGYRFKHAGIVSCRYRWHDANISHKKEQSRLSELYILNKALRSVEIHRLCNDLPWHDDPASAERKAYERIARVFSAKGDRASAQAWLKHRDALQ